MPIDIALNCLNKTFVRQRRQMFIRITERDIFRLAGRTGSAFAPRLAAKALEVNGASFRTRGSGSVL